MTHYRIIRESLVFATCFFAHKSSFGLFGESIILSSMFGSFSAKRITLIGSGSIDS